MRSPISPGSRSSLALGWLARLRWASLAGLIAAAAAVQVFWRVRLPIWPLGGCVLALAGTNVALTLLLGRPESRRSTVGAVLAIDVVLLTAVLALAGGPVNPFSIVYLVGITIAAVALGTHWAIGLATLSTVAYALTFVHHRPLEFMDPSFSREVLTLHVSGMWVAFAAAAGLIAYFVGRLSEALTASGEELALTRAAAARTERLSALYALGAGAAHELATPLSTISTAATELEHLMGTARTVPRGAAAFIEVIRTEVDRCTHVLDQLSARAGATTAAGACIVLPTLANDLRHRLGGTLVRRLDLDLPASIEPVAIPAEPLRQSLIALVRNAFDASPPEARVRVSVALRRDLSIEVVDHGCGIEQANVDRIGEPFFTTKPAGTGLGLGLFLVRAFAAQMGGTLDVQSTPGVGTRAVLTLPRGL